MNQDASEQLRACGGSAAPHACRLRPAQADLGERCPRLLACLRGLMPFPPATLVRFSLSDSGQARLPFATENFHHIQHMPHAAVKEDPLRLFVLLHFADFERVEGSITRAARQVAPWLDQYRILPQPGAAPRWLRTCLVPHRNGGEELVGYGLICDVSGEAENASAVQALASHGGHGPGIGVFRAGADCRYLQVNQPYAELCGYASPEALMAGRGEATEQFGVHPDECAAVLRLVDEHGAVQRYAMELRGRDGAVRWVSLNLRRVLDRESGAPCYEGVCADISEQVRRDGQGLGGGVRAHQLRRGRGGKARRHP